MPLSALASGFLQRSQDGRSSDSGDSAAKGLVGSDEVGAVDCCAVTRWGEIRMTPMAMSVPNILWRCVMMFSGTHAPCQRGLIDNVKRRMLL